MPILPSQQILKFYSLSNKLKRNVGPVLWLLLVVLLVLEAFVLKKSISIIMDSQKVPVPAVQNKGVRINFKDYDEDIKRIENADSFIPTPEAGVDPFTGRRTANYTVPKIATSSQATTTQ